MLGPLTRFPVICSKQTDCSYQDAWNSTSSWKVLEDLGSRCRETNAAEVTRVQDMKIFAIFHGLWLSVHKKKRTGGTSCPGLQAQQHAHSGANLSRRETAGPQLRSQRLQCGLQSRQARSGYPSASPISAALSYLTHVPLCQVPLRKHLSGSMYLQPSFEVLDSGPCLSMAGQTS